MRSYLWSHRRLPGNLENFGMNYIFNIVRRGVDRVCVCACVWWACFVTSAKLRLFSNTSSLCYDLDQHLRWADSESSPISITGNLSPFHSFSDLVLRCFQTYFMNTPIQSVRVRPRENQNETSAIFESGARFRFEPQLFESPKRRCWPRSWFNVCFFWKPSSGADNLVEQERMVYICIWKLKFRLVHTIDILPILHHFPTLTFRLIANPTREDPLAWIGAFIAIIRFGWIMKKIVYYASKAVM